MTPAAPALSNESTPELRTDELRVKHERLEAFLDRQKLAAVLLSRHENIAWITAGQVEARVALGVETAVTTLLITRDGRRYYITSNNEAPRMAEEEFAGLEYEPLIYPWHQGPGQLIREIVGDSPLGSDSAAANTTHVTLTGLRAPLLPAEISRLRALASEVADVTSSQLELLEPGTTEYEMAGRTAAALLERGIAPTVLLMAVDDRIRKFKHAVARKGRLERYGMLNLCARRHGLIISLTRFVHFGPIPAELTKFFIATARINAELLHATRAGATSAQLFAVAKRAYADAGVAGDIELHHQGGPCGYTERDWVITPSGTESVAAPQAFAYNPSVRGAKVEDTTLISDSGAEVLSLTPGLPVIETVIDGITYPAAGILQR